MIRSLLVALCVVLLSGCATQSSVQPWDNAPILWGTILEASPTYKRVASTKSNNGGIALGAVGGAAVGHQFGKGDGKKAMTLLGALAGGAMMSAPVENSRLVRATAVLIREDSTGETYRIVLENNWKEGMVIRFSVLPSSSAAGEYDLLVR